MEPVIIGQIGGNHRLSDMKEENNTHRKWSADSRPTTMFPADLAYCQRQHRGFFSALNWLTPDRRHRRRWPGLGSVLAACVLASCVGVALGQEAPADSADPHLDVRDTLEAPDRAAKQLVVGPGQFGGPPRRLHLPGNGNDNIKSKLQNGPLTLHNGRLRPVATIERVDKDVQLEFDSASSDSNRNFPIRRGGPPMTKTRPSRPGPGNLRKPLPGPRRPSFFPQNNVPFSYNAKPVPEVYINDFSDTNDFREFQQRPSERPGVDLAGDSAAAASEVFHDWSTKVSQSKNGQQKVNLDTKYFSITYPDDKLQVSTTSDPGLSYIAGKPGLVLRKVKGRKKTSTVATVTESLGPGVDAVDRIDIDTVASLQESETKIVDLCQDEALECDTETGMNVTEVEEQPDTKAGSILPTYDQLLKHFKKEFWVIPVLAAAGIMVLILVIFEIFLLSKTINKSPSRRHLFLGQMLLLGLLACAAMATLVTLRPTPLTCAALRLGTGLAYSLVYSTLLVKLVFLISLNSGVYLPATYQSLLLCFALLIQLVIGVQWLVTSPPDVVERPVDSAEDTDTMVFTCATQFKQQLLGLLYVVFLIIVVVILAFKSRGVRENYREAMYVGLTIGFTVSIWVIWVVAGLIVPHPYQDVSIACGLIACTAITFVIMFMPKGRQLSAMGREGVYAEDRTDVYTGDSGTGSTGSSGTPSPSFFPVKPHHKVNHGYHEDKEFKERQRDRERLETPPLSHRNLQRKWS